MWNDGMKSELELLYIMKIRIIPQNERSCTIYAELKLTEDYAITTASENKELCVLVKVPVCHWLFINYCTLEIPALLWRTIV
jgi:hypothetical protein